MSSIMDPWNEMFQLTVLCGRNCELDITRNIFLYRLGWLLACLLAWFTGWLIGLLVACICLFLLLFLCLFLSFSLCFLFPDMLYIACNRYKDASSPPLWCPQVVWKDVTVCDQTAGRSSCVAITRWHYRSTSIFGHNFPRILTMHMISGYVCSCPLQSRAMYRRS